MTRPFDIRALAERTGLSPHTLRYYELAGLILPVPRDATGRRLYGTEHVRWVTFLRRPREGGMGISQIRDYASLTRSGEDPDGSRRREMLRSHREEVQATIERLTDHLGILERKIARGCSPNVTGDGEVTREATAERV